MDFYIAIPIFMGMQYLSASASAVWQTGSIQTFLWSRIA